MAKLTTLDYYSKACLERVCASIKKLCEYDLNLTSLDRHVEILVKYCSDNGYCTFDDIPKEAPKKKAKDVADEEANTPEAQEQMGQDVFAKETKDKPNG